MDIFFLTDVHPIFPVILVTDVIGNTRDEVSSHFSQIQFTSAEFTGFLWEADIAISMDGRSRALGIYDKYLVAMSYETRLESPKDLLDVKLIMLADTWVHESFGAVICDL
jgi:hypothetical protein